MKHIHLSILLFVAALSFQQSSFAQNLKIYSTRKQAAIQWMLTAFQKENPGVTFTVVSTTNWNLVTEIEKQGPNFDGDVYLTKDFVYLNEETEKGFFRPINSQIVKENIPAFMIDKNNYWVGIGLRARTMVYNPNLVKPSELSTYEALAKPEWMARMCLRTSLSSYSVGFTAGLIHNLGDAQTLDVLKGWVENTAIDPTIGDELLLESIESGICGVGVINTHYFAEVLKKNPGMKSKVFFANQDTTGTHVNGSGLAVMKNTKYPEMAQKFVEFMTRKDINAQWAVEEFEYPANAQAAVPESLKPFGTFKRDETPWTDLGKHLIRARELFVESEYN